MALTTIINVPQVQRIAQSLKDQAAAAKAAYERPVSGYAVLIGESDSKQMLAERYSYSKGKYEGYMWAVRDLLGVDLDHVTWIKVETESA